MSNRKYSHDLTIEPGDMIIADGEWATVTDLTIHSPGMDRWSDSHPDAPEDDGITHFRGLHTERGSVWTAHTTQEEITAHAATLANA